MSLEWAPLTEHDAGPLAELADAIEDEDRTGERLTVEEVAERLRNPLLDLADGTIAARDGRRLVAYGCLPIRDVRDGVHAMLLRGGVHPAFRGRGLGGEVLDWATRTAPKLHERAFAGSGLELQVVVVQENTKAAALFERKGLSLSRRFCQMAHGLSELPAVRAPEGIEFVTYEPRYEDAARKVRNASFEDHWGSTPYTAESWRHVVTGSRGFRPEASFVALAGGEAVSILLTHHLEASTAATGVRFAWIDIVGTLREWRGKGVAGNLVLHALAAFKEQGYDMAGLSVDADNPTRAAGVYLRAGFTIYQRSVAYSRMLTPA
ncbi:GNAT family N-acetyltransferase [Nonomuraea rhizosphaerae]|uniref:GNAT family N-acetyltransferase n=1 Tax=Nonomuraea rhizosphaerae TaxID=2665663 RepID=UPI001C5D0D78|nr:GNAT family N-acetyltransferase [Nonomuraea rhizosphaerae]